VHLAELSIADIVPLLAVARRGNVPPAVQITAPLVLSDEGGVPRDVEIERRSSGMPRLPPIE